MRLKDLVVVAGLFALVGCSPPDQSMAPDDEPVATSIRSRGVVVAVTPEYNAVTIQHEPIPELGMPAMTMEFTAAPSVSLDGVDIGDTISFELSGPLDISSITVTDER